MKHNIQISQYTPTQQGLTAKEDDTIRRLQEIMARADMISSIRPLPPLQNMIFDIFVYIPEADSIISYLYDSVQDYTGDFSNIHTERTIIICDPDAQFHNNLYNFCSYINSFEKDIASADNTYFCSSLEEIEQIINFFKTLV